jgi:hypothetical protein
MLIAAAILLLHTQLALEMLSHAKNSASDSNAVISASSSAAAAGNPLPPVAVVNPVENSVVAQPAAESRAALPDAPVPVNEAVNVPAPAAFLRPGKPMTVSIGELQSENHRKLMEWKVLAIASSGAATFDAWSTRHVITTAGAQEMNPLMRPFAGNSSLYAAIQVGPALLDFAGRKMMYNRHSWVRHLWWIPQSAGFTLSMFSGAYNLGTN